MNPIVLVGGLAGLGALLVFGHRSTLRSDGIDVRVPRARPENNVMPANLLNAMIAAIQSGNAGEMRRLALIVRSAGFPAQADELERAARDAARGAGTPVLEVDEVPPDARPVTGDPDERATTQPVEDVDDVPDDAQLTDEQRRIPPGTEQLVADYARMIYASAPSGPVRDLELSDAFKRATNTRGDKKFYGQGPALALIERGVVPPTPWDWQRTDPAADKASYRRQLAEAKRNDPARVDLWDAAIAAVR